MVADIKLSVTLGNSIIGVGVLAMPYCFKQCGIILSMMLLLGCNFLTRIACHILLKSAILARRRSYEILAFHTYGAMGKLAVEFSMIGFLVGTAIAFFVVMGDLGPAILAKILGLENSSGLRTIILITIAGVVVLPLSLMRNIDNLISFSSFSFIFYMVLIIQIVFSAFSNLTSKEWIQYVNLWKPSGILQCLPIFSMALSCQAQIFQIYDAMADPSLKKMNVIVSRAVNLCTLIYTAVGFFGYVTFYREELLSGNIMLNFVPTVMTECIKLGFVLTVAVSFPMVFFPCRASLYSLFFRGTKMMPGHGELTPNYIPDLHWKLITFSILGFSLTVAIFLPNIELVLGLVGSTIGTTICLILPAAMFIKVITKNTNERLMAQLVFCIGVFVLVASTYTNLQIDRPPPEAIIDNPELPKIDEKLVKELPDEVGKPAVLDPALELPVDNKRQEPPIPEAPLEGMKDEKPKEEDAKDKPDKENENKAEAPVKDKEEEKEEASKKEKNDEKQDELIKKLEEQQKAQEKIIEKQEKILAELEKHKEDEIQEKKKEEAAKKEADAGSQEVVREAPVNQDAAKEAVANHDAPKVVVPQHQQGVQEHNLPKKPPVAEQVPVAKKDIMKNVPQVDNNLKNNQVSNAPVAKKENSLKYSPVDEVKFQQPVMDNQQNIGLNNQNPIVKQVGEQPLEVRRVDAPALGQEKVPKLQDTNEQLLRDVNLEGIQRNELIPQVKREAPAPPKIEPPQVPQNVPLVADQALHDHIHAEHEHFPAAELNDFLLKEKRQMEPLYNKHNEEDVDKKPKVNKKNVRDLKESPSVEDTGIREKRMVSNAPQKQVLDGFPGGRLVDSIPQEPMVERVPHLPIGSKLPLQHKAENIPQEPAPLIENVDSPGVKVLSRKRREDVVLDDIKKDLDLVEKAGSKPPTGRELKSL